MYKTHHGRTTFGSWDVVSRPVRMTDQVIGAQWKLRDCKNKFSRASQVYQAATLDGNGWNNMGEWAIWVHRAYRGALAKGLVTASMLPNINAYFASKKRFTLGIKILDHWANGNHSTRLMPGNCIKQRPPTQSCHRRNPCSGHSGCHSPCHSGCQSLGLGHWRSGAELLGAHHSDSAVGSEHVSW